MAAAPPTSTAKGSLKLVTSHSSTTVKAPSSTVSTPLSPPSNVSTPTAPPHLAIRANGTPQDHAPAPCRKMSAVAASPPGLQQSGKMTITSKEWVVPPRPKPGRKPATDTPPTKRKAQNRAAQRAFRERRAARVGELEEQIEEHREEQARAEKGLHDRISAMETEAQNLRTRCSVLENMLERERVERGRVTDELASLKRKWNEQIRTSASSTQGSLQFTTQHEDRGHYSGAGHGPDRPSTQPEGERLGLSSTTSAHNHKSSALPFSISQIISPPDDPDAPALVGCGSCEPAGPCACAEEVLASAMIGCGKCSLGTRCECLEATIKASVSSKRPPPSPSSAPHDEKRLRSDASSTATEIDFTSLYAKKRNSSSTTYLPAPQPQPQQLPALPKDPCGFCKDGTYCVCADADTESDALGPPIVPTPTPGQTQTPPPDAAEPLEVTSTGAIKLPPLHSRGIARTQQQQATSTTQIKGGCGPNGPGTCAQCLSDPKSGLFCRSLAANFDRKGGGSSGGGCCGNGGPGGCCRAQQLPLPQPQQQQRAGISLSCADAYKTLASHRHFDEAADEIETWLPKLRAVPSPRNGAMGRPDVATLGRAPIEVEAASIMSVLKGFDVRFGRGL